MRIGLLVDSVIGSQYVYDLTTWAQFHRNIIIASDHRESAARTGAMSRVIQFAHKLVSFVSKSGLFFGISELAFMAVNHFERALIRRDKSHFVHLRQFDLRSCQGNDNDPPRPFERRSALPIRCCRYRKRQSLKSRSNYTMWTLCPMR